MPVRTRFVLPVLLALAAALPAGTTLADDICRRPCQTYLPQKGEIDPTAHGCHDLIDNLSGTCTISAWDLRGDDDVDITVHASPRLWAPLHHGNRQRVWIELG